MSTRPASPFPSHWTTPVHTSREEMRAFLSSPPLNRMYHLTSPSPDASLPISVLAYSDVGDPEGTPVVVILGLGGHRYFGAAWHAAAAAHKLRLIVVDRPGKGGSTPPGRGNVGVEEVVGAVGQLVRELGLGKVKLMGHSLGGTYVLGAAAGRGGGRDWVQEVDSVTCCLLAPWCSRDWEGVNVGFPANMMKGVPGWVLKVIGRSSMLGLRCLLAAPSKVRGWMMKDYGLNERLFVEQSGVLEMVRTIMQKAEEERRIEGYEWDFLVIGEKGIKWGFQPSDVTAKMAIFWGERDRLVNRAAMMGLRRQIPKSEFWSFPDSTHELLCDPNVMDKVFSTLSIGAFKQ